MAWMPEFLVLALLGGLGIALIAAPLGVFMVWQRQSYFGATLAHSALLGVSLGLFWNIDLSLSVIALSLLIAFGIHQLARKTQLSSDTLLGILAHSSLALGLVLLSLQNNVQIDIMSYLFGDILSITPTDLLLIAAVGLITLLFYLKHWRDLLNITLNRELAQVEGIAVKRIQLQYVLLLALMIALSMKIVGVLLVTSLLIIPAAAARRLATTPQTMLFFSLILGVVSVIGGLAASFVWDIPTGPAIVLAATLIFLMLLNKKAPN
ncbi:iron chelate uptake ABC transporter family permease subunit [Thiomicrorhabdus cannonii]|uniref:iron chelate uptake ABC transporter family permease subunit n=1 Tax=Thiomicrorhabdus cannonii TaxID=2748011 RepID=UPI001C4CE1DC|nr:iron chelate uptake ABC transporter family permease subunit [Thiomicrorhabdus cannonii]